MNESRAITGLDRLPWLADESEAPRRATSGARPLAIALLILGIAVLSYWLGTKSWTFFPERAPSREAPAPIPLPEATPAEPEPDMLNEPAAEPEPLPVAPAVRARPEIRAPAAPRQERRAAPAKGAAADSAKEEAKEASGPPSPWPVRKVDGAAGRLVQVGTFSTRRQAKRGWNALMRVNPALQRLPAMVVPVRSRRDNKVYYRLQMGTTSQAHSVVLCQRMRMIGQSCIVLADAVEKKAE